MFFAISGFVFHFFMLVSSSSASLAVDEPYADHVCARIASSISSSSGVYFPGDALYDKGVFHWANFTTQAAKCVVEPGIPGDVGIILGIVGKTRTRFAVKGGGHAVNPGFSSSTGVQISMSRFSDVVYNPRHQTAEIGAGLIWDDVYAVLEPYGVNVVGGRTSGVGVAGFTLGGGYSWKTNQYGLTIDTVTAFELVKPDGNVVRVTKASDPGLFFGLKGGFNNFGIVTKFTLRTFPQTQVWGGSIATDSQHIAEVMAATAAFSSKVTDPKAAMINQYVYVHPAGQNSLSLFYDGPTPPPGIFDDFLAIPSVAKDVSTRSFLSLIQGFNTQGMPPNIRVTGTATSVLALTPSFLAAVLNQTNYWGAKLAPKSGIIAAVGIQSFLPSIYSHNSDHTAYPPMRSKGFLPLDIAFEWTNEGFDGDFHDAARAMGKALLDAAKCEGQDVEGALMYPNYAIFGTPLEDIYGRHLGKLRNLKAKVDPGNVMGLTGGWRF
ncbi:hypothetical protein M413DRAFT_239222 [Hebeloma cylindrosporum]|uniref:FAD-binding PCMH-type domain-containing protein n=1 Tax=Hebeloma cylindrosporum TaxID=76867 RepID=A0A0C3BQI1_HEBCY|nr:hypothetical protein M413DRAFT_239222 [Hebeloma cylindrosporum h7]